MDYSTTLKTDMLIQKDAIYFQTGWVCVCVCVCVLKVVFIL